MFGISKRSISPNIRILLLPVVSIVVVAILSVFILKEAYLRISKQNRELRDIKGNELVLQEKIEILRQLKAGALDDGDKSLLALPRKNPGLWMLSNFKKQLSDKESISLLNIESTDVEDLKGVAEVTNTTLVLEFEVTNVSDLLSVLTTIKDYAPLSTYELVKFESKNDGIYEARVETNLFWSELPTVITSVKDPVNGLNSREKEILDKVSGYVMPEFSNLDPQDPTNRDNPFN